MEYLYLESIQDPPLDGSPVKSLGQIGYEQYVSSFNALNQRRAEQGLKYETMPLPPWNELSPDVRISWAIAAETIRAKASARFAQEAMGWSSGKKEVNLPNF